MIIGIPKEIKANEHRIGMTPAGVKELTLNGHRVLVQKDGGASIGFYDENYITAGAEIIKTPEEIFATADLIIKVKEPQLPECKLLRPNQILFTYLHLAPDPAQAEALIASGATCIAYETVTQASGGLPLLAPMSEVAGRLSITAGAHHMQMLYGGSGMLLGGVPGVEPAKVLIIGGGVVGINAAKMALGLGAQVTLVDRSIDRLRQLDDIFNGRVRTLFSTADTIEREALQSQLIIGAVLIPGASAPKLITRELVGRLSPGTVMVDVAIDQGGCFETSRATTHQDPTYVIDGVIHYCVANMPGAVARTSTVALTNATLPFAVALANKGAYEALNQNPHLANGLNVNAGLITHASVAEALGKGYTPWQESFSSESVAA
ncbi:MAG: alanine dehydrogenase [Halieaceae bacterium]|nr:alanine dehydrogenase [Halieaceae bacterium]